MENLKHVGRLMYVALKVIGSIVAVTYALSLISAQDTMQGFVGLGLLLLVVFGWYVWAADYVWPKIQKRIGKHLPVMIVSLLAIGIGMGCTRVDPGHVGIKVNYYGSQKGVDDFPAVTGMVWYNPWATTVFQYPTFIQTAVWTHNAKESNSANEEVSFNSREGLVFNADISLSYRLDPTKVPHFYVTFRSDDLDKFTHGFLRNIARDSFNESAVKYTAEEIYGDKKESLLAEVRQRINQQTAAYGVVVEQFGFIGAPRPPQNVVDAINAKIKATQDAIRVENELRSATAEAKKAVATAQGRAQAVLVEAEAQAKANTLLSQSLSPQLIQQKAIDKWNGVRPTVEGSGGGLLLTLPAGK